MNDKVNWKQTRVDAAISAMNGILSRNNNLPFNTHEKEVSEEVARISVVLADALIAELKNIVVMTKKDALKILIEYNEWLRGADTEMLPPKLIGQAIDVAIECLTNSVEQQ